MYISVYVFVSRHYHASVQRCQFILVYHSLLWLCIYLHRLLLWKTRAVRTTTRFGRFYIDVRAVCVCVGGDLFKSHNSSVVYIYIWTQCLASQEYAYNETLRITSIENAHSKKFSQFWCFVCTLIEQFYCKISTMILDSVTNETRFCFKAIE